MPTEPTQAEVIARALESRLLDVFGPMPAIVTAFNPGSVGQAPSVDVLPVVQRSLPTDDDGTLAGEPLPIVPNVPLVYLTAAGARITFPVAPGDTVLLIPLMLAITQWRLTGAPIVAPGTDQGLHHLANCVAVPGLLADALTTAGVDPVALAISSPAQINVESLAINVTGGAAVNVSAPAVTIGDDTGNLTVAIGGALNTGVVVTSPNVQLGSALATDPVANGATVDAAFTDLASVLSTAPGGPITWTPPTTVGFTKVKAE